MVVFNFQDPATSKLFPFTQHSTIPLFHCSVQKLITFFTAKIIRLGLGR